MTESLTDKCKRLEHFETPVWAVKSILNRESFPTDLVIDPCCGTGVLAREATIRDYIVECVDIEHWGFPLTIVEDYLAEYSPPDGKFSVLMNPPFSKAVEFVKKAISDGAEKIICFQRFAWWESRTRRDFWNKNPPTRVYICGDRAASWRHDISDAERKSSSPTAHAWFVWEKDWRGKTELHHIWKD